MSQRPTEHIDDSLKLLADGEVVLFEITPSDGTGVLRVKPDNDVEWLGNTYVGIPIQLTGEKKQSDTGFANPRLTIGQENVDLSLFKPLIADGSLDNAKITKITVLLDNLRANRDVKEIMTYRVKQVQGYSSIQITLLLATYSDSLGFELPIMAYDQPDFQAVQL
jgi:phage-related protein